MNKKWKLLTPEEAAFILSQQTEENTIHSGMSLHCWDDIFKIDKIIYKSEGSINSEYTDVYMEETY